MEKRGPQRVQEEKRGKDISKGRNSNNGGKRKGKQKRREMSGFISDHVSNCLTRGLSVKPFTSITHINPRGDVSLPTMENMKEDEEGRGGARRLEQSRREEGDEI